MSLTPNVSLRNRSDYPGDDCQGVYERGYRAGWNDAIEAVKAKVGRVDDTLDLDVLLIYYLDQLRKP